MAKMIARLEVVVMPPKASVFEVISLFLESLASPSPSQMCNFGPAVPYFCTLVSLLCKVRVFWGEDEMSWNVKRPWGNWL